QGTAQVRSPRLFVPEDREGVRAERAPCFDVVVLGIVVPRRRAHGSTCLHEPATALLLPRRMRPQVLRTDEDGHGGGATPSPYTSVIRLAHRGFRGFEQLLELLLGERLLPIEEALEERATQKRREEGFTHPSASRHHGLNVAGQLFRR